MAALLLAIACKLPAYAPADRSHGGGSTEGAVDADQDGYDASVDCNDADSSVHPGTKETCGNGQDDNCNGLGDGCPWSGEATLEGWELSGSEPDERFGSTLAVCDADGDGQQDLVVGSVGTNDDTGAVHVFYGPFGEDTPVLRTWTIIGNSPSSTLGTALDCRSDMTGDGAADLLIGEPDETGKTAGMMYVVRGGDTGVTPIADAFTSAWRGKYPGDRFGYGVVALNADGYDPDEIAVTSIGTPGWKTTEYGVTYVVGSSPGTHSAYSADASVFGTIDSFLTGTAGNAGDMNGDGIDELALTARQLFSGDAVLLYQRALSDAIAAGDADVAIENDESFVAGWTRLGHADLNGDGYDDFLIGNPPEYGNAGAVLVFHGLVLDDGTDHEPDVELIGRKDSYTGKAIASPGDLDGDGKAELLIGAPGAGGVYLHRGGETGHLQLDDDAQASWWRAEDASDSGAALGAGNVTGDVVGDFVIGAPLAGDENKGAVVLVPSLDL